MLHLSGQYDDDDIKAFRRYWTSMVKGIKTRGRSRSWFRRTRNRKHAFEKFGVEFDEMYFSKWMTFLTSLICAIYGMCAVGNQFRFVLWRQLRRPSLAPIPGEKLAASKDSGLRPLLATYENT